MPEQRKLRSQPQPADGGRKKTGAEINAYLDNLVLSKRPAKTVRMKRNFLITFATLIGKEYPARRWTPFTPVSLSVPGGKGLA